MMKKELYTLAVCEFIERFINFGVFTALVLKLKQSFHFSDQAAFAIFGLYTLLSYASLITGGIVADKWLGTRQAIIIGGSLIFFSTLALSFNDLTSTYIGFSLLVMGTALFKVNCTSLVGCLFPIDAAAREKGFTLLYSCMNLGAVFGPITFGILALHWGWTACFLMSAVLMLAALSLFITTAQFHEYQRAFSFKQQGLIYAGVVVACCFVLGIFLIPLFKISIFSLLALLLLFFFVKMMVQATPTLRKNILGILLLNTLCICFFACSFQVATSIALFIDGGVSKVLFGWTIPTLAFSSLDPLFVVLTAPLFTYLWHYLATKKKEPNVTTKIGIGLLLASGAFYLLSIAATHTLSHPTMVLGLIVVVNVCLGAGEMCLVPAVLSTISHYAPAHLKSTLMGSLYLFVSSSGYLAGFIATSRHHIVPTDISQTAVISMMYHPIFIQIMVFALIASLGTFLLKPLITYLFKTKPPIENEALSK